ESCKDSNTLMYLPNGCKVSFGAEAVRSLAELGDVDCVVNAVVGEAGIYAGFSALKAGKVLAYANKESIVVGGDLLMPLVQPGQLIPVDSEHSAIFQCLIGENPQDIRKIWLTCSGGPFFGYTRSELQNITVQDALSHPTWKMGAKITIDCATLMNKGLEVIEAHHLFNVPMDKIEVLVHRQSRIHSMIEFIDGSVKAQLGASDMRLPIQYALSYPNRWPAIVESVEWREQTGLTGDYADEKTFGCLALARHAGSVGGTLPCVMNAANEVANQAFRQGRCSFLDIEQIVEKTMNASEVQRVEDLKQLTLVDAEARSLAQTFIR
ncbi:MAG: 1-deoxy-D-xylulose-5-phosphate reductoisomerase, partial [Atopobiaceae bacterium]|nr:1-deoxy-D-xylulose-5-phosphate reductoisomerase [Atopobiaceae bacterium]